MQINTCSIWVITSIYSCTL